MTIPTTRARAEGAIEALRAAAEEVRIGVAVSNIPVEARPAVTAWLRRQAEQRLDRARKAAGGEPAVSSAGQAPARVPRGEGPEYTACGCGHIEPDHEPDAGECYSCDCPAYAPAAAPARQAPATDPAAPSHRAGLREQIADTLATADGWVFAPGFKEISPTYQGFLRQADAVLAVLYREWPWLRAETEDAASADQAAQWRAAADVVEAMNEGCGQRKPCASCDAREDAADALRDTARRLAADEQPGARHVHITIRHPDPTTAHTAALCIADLIRGEYGDSLRLAITTDAQDTGAGQSRPADETPETQPQPTAAEEAPEDTARRFARRLFAVERLCSGRPGYHTLTVKQVLTAISEADDEPAAGARQDGAQP